MNARAPPAKMEAHAQTMLTHTPALVGLVFLASTAKPTSPIVLKAHVLMEEHAQIKSTATPVPAAQASLAPTANTKSMSVTLSPASTEASVKMPWHHSVAPAPRATLATAARHQLTGADAHPPAKTEDAAGKRMLPSFVTVLTAGLDAFVTSPGSLVRQLLAREASRLMSYATTMVTVSTLGIPTIVSVRLTTPEAIAKAK